MSIEIVRIADSFDGWNSWRRVSRQDGDGVQVDGRMAPDGTWEWGVTVDLAEFIRKPAFRLAIEAAITSVEGVSEVFEEDTETWNVFGPSSGEELARAAAQVVDKYLHNPPRSD